MFLILLFFSQYYSSLAWREDASSIVYGLYAGNEYNANDTKWIDHYSINDIISVGYETDVLYYSGNRSVDFHHEPLDESTMTDREMKRALKRISQLIMVSLSIERKVLVYSKEGINRAPASVFWYLQHLVRITTPYETLFHFLESEIPEMRLSVRFIDILRSEEY